MIYNINLQKFRLYLKRLSGVAQQQNGMLNTVSGTIESKGGATGRYDIQTLAASAQVPPETLAALHAELLGRPIANMIPTVDQTALMQACVQGSKLSLADDHPLAYGQPLVKCHSSIANSFPQSIINVDITSSGYGAWPPSSTLGPVGVGRLGVKNNNTLVDILQYQHRHRHQQKSPIHDQNRSINVQPSCLVVPAQSSDSFQAVNSVASAANKDCSFGRNTIIDYNLLSLKSNNSLCMPQYPDEETKARGLLCGYNTPSISPQMSPFSAGSGNRNIQQIQNSIFTFGAARPLPGLLPMTNREALHGIKFSDSVDQTCLRNLGFVGNGTCIPSFENNIESSACDFSQLKVSVDRNGNRVEETNFITNPK